MIQFEELPSAPLGFGTEKISGADIAEEAKSDERPQWGRRPMVSVEGIG